MIINYIFSYQKVKSKLTVYYSLLSTRFLLPRTSRKFKTFGKLQYQSIIYYLLLTAYCSLLTACTGSSEAFIEKAKEQMMKGKAQEALPFLNKAIDKDPSNPKAFNMRGAAYFELKDYVNASLDYEKVMQLDPKDYRPYFNRASIKMEKSDWEGALTDCSKAIKIQSDTADNYIKRGMILAALKQPENAIKDFNKAISLKPSETNALYNRGNIYFQLNELEKAGKDFETAIRIDPVFGKAFFGLGIVQQKMGKKDAACLSLKRASTLGYPDAKEALETYCN